MSRKIHPSAKLKLLPAPVQKQLYDLYQRASGEACLEWLAKEHKVKSSTGALSEFSYWFPFSRPLELVKEHAEIFKSALKSDPNLKLNAEQLTIASQIAFEQMALQDRNLKGFVSLQKVRLKQGDQRLLERRVKLLEAAAQLADRGKEVASNKDLSPEEQLNRFKQIFGSK